MTAEVAAAPIAEDRRRARAQFARFLVTGIIATVLDLGLFVALCGIGLPPLIANPLSMAVRLGVAFWLTRSWVFGERERRGAPVEAAGFLALAGANILVVEAALWVAERLADGDLSTSVATAVKIVAIAATFAGRFVVSRRYVFRAQ